MNKRNNIHFISCFGRVPLKVIARIVPQLYPVKDMDNNQIYLVYSVDLIYGLFYGPKSTCCQISY